MHGRTECIQLLLPYGINDHRTIAIQCLQPGNKLCETIGAISELFSTALRCSAIQLVTLKPQHRGGWDGPITLFLQPGIQTTRAETKAAISGESAPMDRLAMQQMDPIHRGASTGKKSRHMQRGVHRSEAISKLVGKNRRLQHPMAAKGGISPADQHELLITDPLSFKSDLERSDDLTIALCRSLRRQSTGVRQHEQERRRVTQSLTQGLYIPAQQQWAAVHGLRSRGIVIDHDDFQGVS